MVQRSVCHCPWRIDMNPPPYFLFTELFAVVVVSSMYHNTHCHLCTMITSFRKMTPEQQPSNVNAFCFQTQSTAQLAIIQSFVGATVLPLFNLPPSFSGDEKCQTTPEEVSHPNGTQRARLDGLSCVNEQSDKKLHS